ncbi:MAG: PQQ-binding-like beta-propeller repeat protein [Thermoplasmatota archaeon]
MNYSFRFSAVVVLIICILLSSVFNGIPFSVSGDLSVQSVDDGFREQLAFIRYPYSITDDDVFTLINFAEENRDFVAADGYEQQPALPVVLGGPQDSPWPMQSFNNRHLGRSPYSTMDTPGIEKWRFKCKWQEGGITIATDGSLYFADWYGWLYALNPNGTLIWKYLTNGIIWSSPAIAEDGTIYVGTWGCSLYAFNPDGSVKWVCNSLGGTSSSSPAIGEDGTIYLGTMKGTNKGEIVAVTSNGTVKWRYATGYLITSDPAIDDNGIIYIGSGDTYLYAMYPNGTLKWRFKTGHYIKGPPSIADDGTVYIGSCDNYLYALYPNNGTMKWRCKVVGGTETNPSIGSDGTIYVGGSRLYAIYPNGTMKWEVSFGPGRSIHKSCPAVCADGIIYVGTNIYEMSGGEIIAVYPNGTERWRKYIATLWVQSSPSIASDGTVYIGSSSRIVSTGVSYGFLHAFGCGPLIAHANGPYSGYYQKPVSFTAEAYGGEPPYTYHWGFGDGNTSEEQNPTHAYQEVGNYTATLTVYDSVGNLSIDNASVTIVYSKPSVIITKPYAGIYIMNLKVLPWPSKHSFVFGPISVIVDAEQYPFGIDRVEFFVNRKYMATDTTAPYRWIWLRPSFGEYYIQVVAYDNAGGSSSYALYIRKFF